MTPITKLIDGADVDVSVRVAAVQCLVDVSHYTSLRDCGVVLFHPLARALDTTPEVQAVAMELLETLLTHMGQNYQLFGFVKIIGEIVARHKIQADGYGRQCPFSHANRHCRDTRTAGTNAVVFYLVSRG